MEAIIQEKFLYFQEAKSGGGSTVGADDVAMYPTHKLAAVTCAVDTTILMQFASGVAGGTGAGGTESDTITLTITAGTEVAVMKSIARAANATGPQYSDGVIVIADDVNSVYVDAGITDAAIGLDT